MSSLNTHAQAVRGPRGQRVVNWMDRQRLALKKALIFDLIGEPPCVSHVCVCVCDGYVSEFVSFIHWSAQTLWLCHYPWLSYQFGRLMPQKKKGDERESDEYLEAIEIKIPASPGD